MQSMHVLGTVYMYSMLGYIPCESGTLLVRALNARNPLIEMTSYIAQCNVPSTKSSQKQIGSKGMIERSIQLRQSSSTTPDPNQTLAAIQKSKVQLDIYHCINVRDLYSICQRERATARDECLPRRRIEHNTN